MVPGVRKILNKLRAQRIARRPGGLFRRCEDADEVDQGLVCVTSCPAVFRKETP